MAATDSITIVKTWPYRGSQEEWSNTYHFDGATPASDASWKALADAIIADEAAILRATCSIIRAIGHVGGSTTHVWAYDYAANDEETAGTYVVASGEMVGGGDSACWIRWSTDQLTSKGKPIYLRSYYHPGYGTSAANPDDVYSTWVDAAQTYGDAWIAGYDDGDSVTHHRAGPNGAIGLVALPSPEVTTRTLERRGRRPPP